MLYELLYLDNTNLNNMVIYIIDMIILVFPLHLVIKCWLKYHILKAQKKVIVIKYLPN